MRPRLGQLQQHGVLLWLVLLAMRSSATIIQLRTNESIEDRAAMFGPLVNLTYGLTGVVVPMRHVDPVLELACTANTSWVAPIPAGTQWIALVLRGQCDFVDKVRNMQLMGAAAVIVGNNVENGGIVRMYSEDDASDVNIPSVSTSKTSYDNLRNDARLRDNETVYDEPVKLIFEESTQWIMLDIIIAIIIVPSFVCVFVYAVWRLRLRRLRQQELASPPLVNNLPIKKFSKANFKDMDPETCAICLEDFQDNEELRVLPCKHEFHKACIDPWLTTRKRFCPLCKMDACPDGSATSSESTALLRSQHSVVAAITTTATAAGRDPESLLSVNSDADDRPPALIVSSTPTPIAYDSPATAHTHVSVEDSDNDENDDDDDTRALSSRPVDPFAASPSAA